MLRSLTFALAALTLAVPAVAGDKTANSSAPAPASETEMTAPTFEMFRLAPGKTEAFIRDMEAWDKVSAAGGVAPTLLFLHAGGEGWDVLLYKPARPKPTAAQIAVMAAKAKELGLPSGALYYVGVRELVADHVHFEGSGPMTAAQWVAGIDRERAERARAK